jgi:hypothetical protein
MVTYQYLCHFERGYYRQALQYWQRCSLSGEIQTQEQTMSNDIKDNIKQPSTWIRGLYMLLFSIFYTIAEVVLFAVVLFQFILKLFSGDTNERLRKLGQCIGTYIYQIIQFLSFNTDVHPYPFGAWPKGEPRASKKAEISESKVDKD